MKIKAELDAQLKVLDANLKAAAEAKKSERPPSRVRRRPGMATIMSRTPSGPANTCWSSIMSDFSLVPVDYQPDFTDVSFIPVDHDPFSADGATQPGEARPENQAPPLATGAGQPGAGTSSVDVSAPMPASEKSRVDWAHLNRPTGELRSWTPRPSERLGYAFADGLMAAGMQPYHANRIVRGLGSLLGVTPASFPVFAADLIDAKNRDDMWGVARAAADMVPGTRAGGAVAERLAMGLEARLARAKEMGFFTQMPLYHGSGQSFEAIRSVPTNAPGQALPGVSLTRNPEIANEFAAMAPDRGLGGHPQVYKLLHRAKNPASLNWRGMRILGRCPRQFGMPSIRGMIP
ncbi:hypothetical protein [Bradyrhizobium ivorense]|uniref:hypothetical protein n=1 Tax=Bradyrhizobium ivorense TaxID=2511166 RepID=UPI0010B3A894|nr:hypothetical protein [Bradyrhizobium ivorense]VIO77371.1 hypothetical protein CI41S_56260 [Bradyrhizobium ivorense]